MEHLPTETRKHRPRYRRAEVPPAMRFRDRDGAILRALYDYDGVLARRHLKAMFWPDATWRAMEMRLSLLYHQAYLDWPNQEQWQTKPIPEAICWLGWKGIAWLANEAAIAITPPATATETKLRLLDRELNQHGLNWLREPRWSQLMHDLAIVDVRLAVEQATQTLPSLKLETWVSESAFLSQMDVVEFSASHGRDVHKRGVRPDGYFALEDEARRSQGLPARARFLLEVDMATHTTDSFIREKVLAGLAYLKSAAYRNRFGDNSGRWLVVVKSETRLKHLMEETGRAISEPGAFWFTTLEQVTQANVLTGMIWRRADRDERLAIFNPLVR